MSLLDRITIDPDQCGGKPCVRHLRIRVSDVPGLLARGFSEQQVLEEHPDLERLDIAACILYVSEHLDPPPSGMVRRIRSRSA